MLELGEDTERDCVSFNCPCCDMSDTTYQGMPVKCYVCNYIYIEDLEELIDSWDKRKAYYTHKLVMGLMPRL